MKPKTPFQIRISNLAKNLKPISKAQSNWAFKNCFDHIGILSKKGTVHCLECGTSFQLTSQGKKSSKATCTKCLTDLKLEQTLKRNFDDWTYMTIIDKIDDIQLVRNIKVWAKFQKGKKAQFAWSDTSQFWIDGKGNCELISKIHCTYFQDYWYGSLELRKPGYKMPDYDINPYKIYPKMKLIKELERTKFKRRFFGPSLQATLVNLLKYPHMETLLKSGNINLFNYEDTTKIKKYWGSIKICIRNSYQIKDVSMWFDYLELLKKFNRDVQSPKYICPKDLAIEHDRFVKKDTDLIKKIEYEKRMSSINSFQTSYAIEKGKFFGLRFMNQDIEINVLTSVKEFLDISIDHNHCVFNNEYFNKKDSLVMIAKQDGIILETIEVSLKTFVVLQSRGYGNKQSPKHTDILTLVNSNMKEIQKIAMTG